MFSERDTGELLIVALVTVSSIGESVENYACIDKIARRNIPIEA
jgi:hypothetical protein